MMKNVESLVVGDVIPMLGGVVKVESVEVAGETTTVRIHVGRLHNHPMRFSTGFMIETVTMPRDVAPFFGV